MQNESISGISAIDNLVKDILGKDECGKKEGTAIVIGEPEMDKDDSSDEEKKEEEPEEKIDDKDDEDDEEGMKTFEVPNGTKSVKIIIKK